jgi:hypothetical protein
VTVRKSLIELAAAASTPGYSQRCVVVPARAYRLARHGHIHELKSHFATRAEHRTAERCVAFSMPERDEVLLVFEGFDDDGKPGPGDAL